MVGIGTEADGIFRKFLKASYVVRAKLYRGIYYSCTGEILYDDFL